MDGSDRVTGDLQHDAQYGSVLVLPFLHDFVLELVHVRGGLVQLLFVGIVDPFGGGFKTAVVDCCGRAGERVTDVIEPAHCEEGIVDR